MDELIQKFIDKIKIISKKCDAIHITENVLGFKEEFHQLMQEKLSKKKSIGFAYYSKS